MMKEPKDLKVAELRDELQSRGLSTKGLKKDLVERLEEALKGGPSTVSEPVSVLSEDQSSKPEEIFEPVPQSDDHSDPTTAVAEEDQKLDIETTDAPTHNEPALQTSLPLSLLPDEPVSESHHRMEKQAVKPLSSMDAHALLSSFDKKPELGALAVDYGDEESEEIDIMSQPMGMDHSLKRKDNVIESDQDHAKKAKTDVVDSAMTNGHALGEILHISELVRPFTVHQLQSMLETFGPIEELWMNSIKSQCYVKYVNKDESMRAKTGLDGQLWPKDTGKHLKVALVERATVVSSIQHEHERTGTGHKLGFADATTETSSKVSESAPVSELDPHLHHKTPKGSQGAAGPLPIEEKVNLSLTDIFKLTSADPPLYYLPRVDEKSERRTDRRGHHARSHSRH